MPYDDDSVLKLVIPKELCPDFRKALNGYGINRATLFPDLDGLASDIAWGLRNAAYDPEIEA